jgi:hypothetical protein
MPLARTDARPLPYQKEAQPRLAESKDATFAENYGSFSKYSDEQLEAIELAIKILGKLVPQVSEAEPEKPQRGLIRFAIHPWHPLSSTGTTDDGWVYYNGSAWVAL